MSMFSSVTSPSNNLSIRTRSSFSQKSESNNKIEKQKKIISELDALIKRKIESGTTSKLPTPFKRRNTSYSKKKEPEFCFNVPAIVKKMKKARKVGATYRQICEASSMKYNSTRMGYLFRKHCGRNETNETCSKKAELQEEQPPLFSSREEKEAIEELFPNVMHYYR